MNDANFQKLITRTVLAFRKYDALKVRAEKEYERRFKYNPSDIDDDFWIDTIHYGQGSTNLKEILDAALYSKNMEDKRLERLNYNLTNQTKQSETYSERSKK